MRLSDKPWVCPVWHRVAFATKWVANVADGRWFTTAFLTSRSHVSHSSNVCLILKDPQIWREPIGFPPMCSLGIFV